MKKLLTMMIIIACATFAHAAACSWSSGAYKLVDDKGVALTSLTGGSIVLALLGTEADYSDATVLDTGVINSTSKNAGKVSGKYSFTYGEAGSLDNGDILAVLFKSDDGKLSKLLTADGSSEMYKEYTVSGIGDDTWSRTDYTFATGNFQAPVPEPTSGLLLLVGASLLALRRKQK